IVCMLSGPEPQRSIFEQKISRQISNIQEPVTIVRGVPLQAAIPFLENVTVHNHLPAEALETLLQSAKVIICRSGYSSVMDINALKQKSVLVPTPGQTEQEYLGRHLMENGFALSVSQEEFDLAGLLRQASGFDYRG